ncbi:MAG: SRPBCC family protein [Haloferacaceae archaeon]
MDEICVSAVVHVSQEEAYEFLLDFPGYAKYSQYLEDVERFQGEGGPGTRYGLTFSWWKLSYTAHSKVTSVDPPERIDWRLTKDIDAYGHWRTEPLDLEPKEALETDSGAVAANPHGEACEVTFTVFFDPESARSGVLDLPRIVSFDWVLSKVVPRMKREAERIVSRAVADLEGRPRAVELDVHVDTGGNGSSR